MVIRHVTVVGIELHIVKFIPRFVRKSVQKVVRNERFVRVVKNEVFVKVVVETVETVGRKSWWTSFERVMSDNASLTPRVSLIQSPALLDYSLKLVDDVDGNSIPEKRSCIDVDMMALGCLFCVESAKCFGKIAWVGTRHDSSFSTHAVAVVTGH